MEQENKISVSAMVNSLPQQLVSEIYSQKRTVYPFSFFSNPKPVQVNYKQEEYALMIKGAYLANQKPHYLEVKLYQIITQKAKKFRNY